MTKCMFQEEKIEKIIALVVDELLQGEIKSRISYKFVNDDTFRSAVTRLSKSVLAYCNIAAEDKTGVGLTTWPDALLPRISDDDVIVVVKKLVMENAGQGSALEEYASSKQGVGLEIFQARINGLLSQLN